MERRAGWIGDVFDNQGLGRNFFIVRADNSSSEFKVIMTGRLNKKIVIRIINRLERPAAAKGPKECIPAWCCLLPLEAAMK